MHHTPEHATVGLLPSAGEEIPRPHRRLDPRFLSVAIDFACLIGAPWWEGTRRTRVGFGHERATPVDLTDPRLLRHAQALVPAFLRLGGSEADRIWYSQEHGSSLGKPTDQTTSTGGRPRGRRSASAFRSVLTRTRWNEVSDFARRSGCELFVTLNAGAGPRDSHGRWDPTNAQELVTYAAHRGDPVSVWEFGNEVSGFPFIHGPGSRVSAGRYAADFTVFHDMIRRHAPDARTAGLASAYWPLVGEMLPFTPWVVNRLERVPDVITWHYYPQQSSRGLLATRRADPFKVLRPWRLNGSAHWARRVLRHARRVGEDARYSLGEPGHPAGDAGDPSGEAGHPAGDAAYTTPQVWLGETGHALYGGEPGVSDRFVAGIWWLDQLGLMARSGVRVVVRQSLVGGDYGLLDTETVTPRPDYWNSLLWKRLMGQHVYAPFYNGSPHLRVYAHNTPHLEGGVSFLLINVHRETEIQVALDASTLGFAPRTLELYTVIAPDPWAATLTINGCPPELPEDSVTPPGHAVDHTPDTPIAVPPLSYVFVVVMPENSDSGDDRPTMLSMD